MTEKLKYTVERKGYDPLKCTIEMKSDQPAQPIDKTVVFLCAAVDELENEVQLCEHNTERRENVATLKAKVLDLRDRALKIAAP